MTSRGSRTAGRLCSCVWIACLALVGAFACALPIGLGGAPEQWQETRVIHSTMITISARDPNEGAARAAIAAAFTAAEEIGGQLLSGVRGSEIDILVHVPSHAWVEISQTTHDALLDAFEVAEATEGAFDPTWTPLLKLWGLTENREPRVPRDFEIDMALRKVDWTNIEITDEEGLSARRLHHRTEIRLGGLARGTMLDGAVAQLRLAGMSAGRASTKDEHVVFGGTRAHPWRVSLPAGSAEFQDGAIAVALRGTPIEIPTGARIHDRFDPRDGRPAEGSSWVAIASRRASTSAAYADAVFAMGSEGREFVEERSELLAVIESEDGSRWISEGLVVRAD